MPFMSQWLVGLVSAANFQTWADLVFTHHLLMLLSQVNLFPYFLFLFSYAWLVSGVIHFPPSPSHLGLNFAFNRCLCGFS